MLQHGVEQSEVLLVIEFIHVLTALSPSIIYDTVYLHPSFWVQCITTMVCLTMCILRKEREKER